MNQHYFHMEPMTLHYQHWNIPWTHLNLFFTFFMVVFYHSFPATPAPESWVIFPQVILSFHEELDNGLIKLPQTSSALLDVPPCCCVEVGVSEAASS